MAERPPIRATGRVTRIHQENRLYEVEMANGYRAYAIVERKGLRATVADPTDREVVVDFSPFDMSRCKVVDWKDSPAETAS